MAVEAMQTPSEVINQILAIIISNIATFAQGCSIGWTSPSLPILRSSESPLTNGPLSDVEAAWVGSIHAIAAVLGTLFFGIFSHYVGCKRASLWCAFPGVTSWIILYLAELPWHLYVARFASGFYGGGVILCLSVYCAEIASVRIRGRLGMVMVINIYFGIVIGFIAGTTLSIKTVPLVMISLPIGCFCMFFWFPQTPQFLIRQNRFEQAEKSLRFYRNCRKNAKDLRGDLAVKEELQKLVTIAKQNSKMPPIKLSEFLTVDTIRAMLIAPALMATGQFSGVFVLSNYATTIFKETGSTVDPNISSIIMACIQLVGAILASSLIDRLGRKMLLLISTAGSALFLTVTGIYCYMGAHDFDVSSLNLLPIISLSAYIFLSSIGINPLPYIIAAEVLPQRVRKFGVTLAVCSGHVFAFIMLRLFPNMLTSLKLYGCLWTFATVSCLGFVFTLFVVRETNGINLDQIQKVESNGEE